MTSLSGASSTARLPHSTASDGLMRSTPKNARRSQILAASTPSRSVPVRPRARKQAFRIVSEAVRGSRRRRSTPSRSGLGSSCSSTGSRRLTRSRSDEYSAASPASRSRCPRSTSSLLRRLAAASSPAAVDHAPLELAARADRFEVGGELVVRADRRGHAVSQGFHRVRSDDGRSARVAVALVTASPIPEYTATRLRGWSNRSCSSWASSKINRPAALLLQSPRVEPIHFAERGCFAEPARDPEDRTRFERVARLQRQSRDAALHQRGV